MTRGELKVLADVNKRAANLCFRAIKEKSSLKQQKLVWMAQEYFQLVSICLNEDQITTSTKRQLNMDLDNDHDSPDSGVTANSELATQN